ncbi:MAG: hypothetical protein HWE14_14740 [Flavobacteriia bacterium]|nr:hypothetical protein [Flavobacteriia bacterium]
MSNSARSKSERFADCKRDYSLLLYSWSEYKAMYMNTEHIQVMNMKTGKLFGMLQVAIQKDVFARIHELLDSNSTLVELIGEMEGSAFTDSLERVLKAKNETLVGNSKAVPPQEIEVLIFKIEKLLLELEGEIDQVQTDYDSIRSETEGAELVGAIRESLILSKLKQFAAESENKSLLQLFESI